MRDLTPRPGRALWAVVLANTLLVQLVTFAIRPATVYRALEIGMPTALLGTLSASFALMPMLLALPSGVLADRVGERVLAVIAGICLTAATVTLTLSSDGVVRLFAGTILLGLGQLCGVIAQQTWVANLGSGSALDGAFGRYTFAASLGQALGPATLTVLGGSSVRPDTAPLFVVGLAASVCALGTALGLRRSATSCGSSGSERPGAGLIRLPGLKLALLTSCVVLAAVDITMAYLPALGVERGIPSATIGVLLVVRALASMTSRIGLGRLVGRLGRRRVLVAFTASAAAAIALCAVPTPLWVLLLAVAAAGVGLGVGQPLTMSWLAEAAPEGARGRAMSLRLVGNRAGQVALPSLTGLVAAGSGASGVLALTGAALGAVAWSARTLPPRRR